MNPLIRSFGLFFATLQLATAPYYAQAQQAEKPEEEEQKEAKPPSALLPNMPKTNKQAGNNPALNNLLVNEEIAPPPSIDEEIERDYRNRDPNDPNKVTDEMKEKYQNEKDLLRAIDRRGRADNPRLNRLKRDGNIVPSMQRNNNPISFDEDEQDEDLLTPENDGRLRHNVDKELQEALWYLFPVIYGEDTSFANEECNDQPRRGEQQNKQPIPVVDRPNRYTTQKGNVSANPNINTRNVAGPNGRDRQINYGAEAQYDRKGRRKGGGGNSAANKMDNVDLEEMSTEDLMKIMQKMGGRKNGQNQQGQRGNQPNKGDVTDSVNDLFNDLQ